MLSTAQAAELASTTRYTVEREIRRGNLAAEKIGRTWVIEPAEAKRWAAQFKPYAGLHRDRREAASTEPAEDPCRAAIRKLPPMR
jgi:excisionase family DNA binding protein